MKSMLLLFLLPISANASFLCDGRKLISNHGAVYSFPSGQQCQAALLASINGFACDGRRLIANAVGKTYNFGSAQQCADAIRASK